MIYKTLVVLFVFLFTQLSSDHDSHVYIVQQGDTLTELSHELGDVSFWEIIYVYNAHQIENPNKIYAGQILYIPQFSLQKETVAVPYSSIQYEYISGKTKRKLEQYKKESLYNSLISSYINRVRVVVEPEPVQNPDPVMEIDGMINDETVTKTGYDFYRMFYSTWQAPEQARNYSIDIAETPGPGLGTIITVKLNGNMTYKDRLKPNFTELEAKSEQAVRATQYYITNFDFSREIY